MLASKSPRRQEILRNLGIEFDVVSSTFEENISKDGLRGDEYAVLTATEKAREVYARTRREEEKRSAFSSDRGKSRFRKATRLPFSSMRGESRERLPEEEEEEDTEN